MNALNRIRYNKPSKLLYYFKSFLGYSLPKKIYQKKLIKTLASFENREDKSYINKRVDYYNKLDLTGTPLVFKCIGAHKYKRQLKSVYFFDTYEYTRWFSDKLKWNYLEGDITKVPEVPSIVKSRPIGGDNKNSVLLNLDKIRHFVFLKDDIAFADKLNKAIFRLAIYNKPHRIDFMKKYFGSSICDAGTISKQSSIPLEWIKEEISLYDHLKYKFILAIEGNDVATNLKWIMSTNSIAVMPKPTFETWFMEGKLIPDYHYIEIKSDYSDLEDRLNYFITHTDKAEAIIANAHRYISQFKDKKREKLISLLVLQKYFVMTGQHPLQTD